MPDGREAVSEASEADEAGDGWHGTGGSSSDAHRRKKTRDLPNLCDCHRCGRRFPNRGRREGLQLLDSHWRLALLCETCFRAVRYAQACSYCFENFAEKDGAAVDCRHCSRRVHLGCLSLPRGYLLRSDLLPEFLCIDCCPFLRIPSKIESLRPARVSAESATSTGFGDADPARSASILDGEIAHQLHAAVMSPQRSNSVEDMRPGVPDPPNQEPDLRICNICTEEEFSGDNSDNAEPLKAIPPAEFLGKKTSPLSERVAALPDHHERRGRENGGVSHSSASLPSIIASGSSQECEPCLPDRYMRKYSKRSPGTRKERSEQGSSTSPHFPL